MKKYPKYKDSGIEWIEPGTKLAMRLISPNIFTSISRCGHWMRSRQIFWHWKMRPKDCWLKYWETKVGKIPNICG